jgi:hypothetical protein
VKHRSYFFRCGIDTEMSLISRRIASSVAFPTVDVALPADPPFAFASVRPFAGPSSTRRRFRAGSGPFSWSYTKLAMLLKRVTRAGESVDETSMPATFLQRLVRLQSLPAARLIPSKISGRDWNTRPSLWASRPALIFVDFEGETAGSCVVTDVLTASREDLSFRSLLEPGSTRRPHFFGL